MRKTFIALLALLAVAVCTTESIAAPGFFGYAPDVYGGIWVSDATSPQSIPTGTTYTKINQFAKNGYYLGTTPDHTNDQIRIDRVGHYLVVGSFNFAGNANVTFRGTAFLNSTEQDRIHWKRKIAANDSGSASLVGIIDVSTAPAYLDFRVRHDSGGSVTYTIEYADFVVYRMSN